ncbi:hypothetical protein MCOR08_009889 [Pyricularia oryzae]|nr:hypothetical protein MCOR08_009889 [Pyricularia oryzae]
MVNKRPNGDSDVIMDDVRHEPSSPFPPPPPPPLIPATAPVVRPAKTGLTRVPRPDHKPDITPDDGPVSYAQPEYYFPSHQDINLLDRLPAPSWKDFQMDKGETPIQIISKAWHRAGNTNIAKMARILPHLGYVNCLSVDNNGTPPAWFGTGNDVFRHTDIPAIAQTPERIQSTAGVAAAKARVNGQILAYHLNSNSSNTSDVMVVLGYKSTNALV